MYVLGLERNLSYLTELEIDYMDVFLKEIFDLISISNLIV